MTDAEEAEIEQAWAERREIEREADRLISKGHDLRRLAMTPAGRERYRDIQDIESRDISLREVRLLELEGQERAETYRIARNTVDLYSRRIQAREADRDRAWEELDPEHA